MIVWQSAYGRGKACDISCCRYGVPESNQAGRKSARAPQENAGNGAVALYDIRRYREDPWRGVDGHSENLCRTVIAGARTYRHNPVDH